MTKQEVALEALKNLVDGLNATEFPMGVWERTEFNLLVKLREGKNKAEAALKLLESQDGCNQPPLEGDVRGEAIKVIEEYYAYSIKDWTCEEIVDALLSKYNFTRKG